MISLCCARNLNSLRAITGGHFNWGKTRKNQYYRGGRCKRLTTLCKTAAHLGCVSQGRQIVRALKIRFRLISHPFPLQRLFPYWKNAYFIEGMNNIKFEEIEGVFMIVYGNYSLGWFVLILPKSWRKCIIYITTPQFPQYLSMAKSIKNKLWSCLGHFTQRAISRPYIICSYSKGKF